MRMIMCVFLMLYTGLIAPLGATDKQAVEEETRCEQPEALRIIENEGRGYIEYKCKDKYEEWQPWSDSPMEKSIFIKIGDGRTRSNRFAVSQYGLYNAGEDFIEILYPSSLIDHKPQLTETFPNQIEFESGKVILGPKYKRYLESIQYIVDEKQKSEEIIIYSRKLNDGIERIKNIYPHLRQTFPYKVHSTGKKTFVSLLDQNAARPSGQSHHRENIIILKSDGGREQKEASGEIDRHWYHEIGNLFRIPEPHAHALTWMAAYERLETQPETSPERTCMLLQELYQAQLPYQHLRISAASLLEEFPDRGLSPGDPLSELTRAREEYYRRQARLIWQHIQHQLTAHDHQPNLFDLINYWVQLSY